MPDIFRYPRIVFPDLAEHQLVDKFQPKDKNYIKPTGSRMLIPFDESYLDDSDKVIFVPIVSLSGFYLRAARIHLWLEPSDGYPRGTRIKVSPFLANTSYSRIVYVGRYTILPMTSWSIDTVAGGVKEIHYDDMQLFTDAVIRIRFKDKDDNTLPDASFGQLPIFQGLVEIG